MLIGGVVRIALPDIGLKIGSALYASPTTLPIIAVFSLGLGGFLTFKGYSTKS
jgi:hypothetical protein